MRRRLAGIAAAACCVLAAVPGCGRGGPAATHASFTDGGVAVTVTLERSGADDVAVSATLRPRRSGFHLYSLGLPDGGVDGLGIPTRLAVAAPLTARGAVSTPAHPYGLRMAGLDVTLPVYPDGPVTLQLATRLTSARSAAPAVLRLTYGACSSTEGCLAPVREHAVAVPVPGA
ncbi:hypothetical protein ACFO3J_20960 [Streptomyces polygonati]|uniref:Thiol:disulfide interchange protein DsbD N-terminal domain-containing protein n=1 Tax=Streptomyces polygonati TaxID=1617087 RepID=A0ABV8HSH6_9ACTN